MKKLIAIFIVVACLLGVGFFFIHTNKSEKDVTITSEDILSESYFEPTKEDVETYPDFASVGEGKNATISYTVEDHVGCTEKEITNLTEDAQAYMDSIGHLLFDFDENTSDFSEELRNQFVSNDYYEQEQGNLFYKLFAGTDMQSKFIKTDLKAMQTREHKGSLFMELEGCFVADFQNTKVEQNTYGTRFYALVKQEDDGKYKLVFFKINKVAFYDDIAFYFQEGSHYTSLIMDGEECMYWDFLDPDGFINGYDMPIIDENVVIITPEQIDNN